MCAKRVKSDEIYETDNVIIGFGEVAAVQTTQGLRWVLPGRIFTACRDEAEKAAQRLDRMIRVNQKRYERSLI